jgi:hypothetical protein
LVPRVSDQAHLLLDVGEYDFKEEVFFKGLPVEDPLRTLQAFGRHLPIVRKFAADLQEAARHQTFHWYDESAWLASSERVDMACNLCRYRSDSDWRSYKIGQAQGVWVVQH